MKFRTNITGFYGLRQSCLFFKKGFVYFLNENLHVIPSFSSFYIKGSVGRLKESQPEFTAC